MRESTLNHSDLKVLQQNRRCLDQHQQALLDVAIEREAQSEFMQRQGRDRDKAMEIEEGEHVDWTCAARCGILLMSCSERAKSFVYCGRGNRVNRRGLCHIYRYCPVCNWAFKAKPTIGEFANDESFFKATWTFVTISFTTCRANSGCFFADDARRHFDPAEPNCVYEILGKYDSCPLQLNDNPGDDEANHIGCWNAGHSAIKSLKKDKLITGYLGNDDLAVRFNTRHQEVFCPCSGLPHTHYIVTTPPGDPLTIGTMEEVHRCATRFLDQACPDLALHVSIKGYGIPNPETLSRLIRYVVKPIDFVEPYGRALLCDEAASNVGTLDPKFMGSLNIGVDYLFDAFENGLFYRRRGVRRGGNLLCDPRTGYVGTKKLPPPRKKRRSGSRLHKLQTKKAHDRIINDPNHEF